MSDLKSQLLRVKAELGMRGGDAGSQGIRAVKDVRAYPPRPVPGQSSALAASNKPGGDRQGRRQAPDAKLRELTKTSVLGRREHVMAAPSSRHTSVVPKPVAEPVAPAAPAGLVPAAPGVEFGFRPLPKGALTRTGLFKLPEPWVAAGGKTQRMPGATFGVLDVVIGIDFGTSFTKAAVSLKDAIYPVTWHGISDCSPPYLLPSEHTTLQNGTLFIGQHHEATSETLRSDLKLPFLDAAVSTASIGAASDFLALVLRYIRAWVYRHHGDKIGTAGIRWQFNLGSPSDGMENERLKAAYRRLGTTSWLRSLCSDAARIAEVPVCDLHTRLVLQDLVEFTVMPEFVAQMAGYMQSPQRRTGLHALIDIGGGTLDAVTFIVQQIDFEDTFPFLVPGVYGLGTHKLLQNRVLGLNSTPGKSVVDALDPVAAPRDFADAMGVGAGSVLARDAIFSAEVVRVVKGVFATTKARRYKLSQAWDSSVTTFFTGGGASVPLYRTALDATPVPSREGLNLVPLPAHPRLAGFAGGSDEYQRISVACGLAQDALTLGRIVAAREVEDDRPTMIERQRTDRDDQWAK